MRARRDPETTDAEAFRENVENMIMNFANCIAEMEVEMELVSALNKIASGHSAATCETGDAPDFVSIEKVDDNATDQKLARVITDTVDVCRKRYEEVVLSECDKVFIDELKDQIDIEKRRLDAIFHHADTDRIKNEVLCHAHDLIAGMKSDM